MNDFKLETNTDWRKTLRKYFFYYRFKKYIRELNAQELETMTEEQQKNKMIEYEKNYFTKLKDKYDKYVVLSEFFKQNFYFLQSDLEFLRQIYLQHFAYAIDIFKLAKIQFHYVNNYDLKGMHSFGFNYHLVSDPNETYYKLDEVTKDFMEEIFFRLIEVNHLITFDMVKRSITFLRYYDPMSKVKVTSDIYNLRTYNFDPNLNLGADVVWEDFYFSMEKKEEVDLAINNLGNFLAKLVEH